MKRCLLQVDLDRHLILEFLIGCYLKIKNIKRESYKAFILEE
ncbi:MAG: hypothetical protein RL631_611, partial [Pseudomonadota bacterium]